MQPGQSSQENLCQIKDLHYDFHDPDRYHAQTGVSLGKADDLGRDGPPEVSSCMNAPISGLHAAPTVVMRTGLSGDG